MAPACLKTHLVAAFALGLLAACGADEPSGDQPLIVASTTILGDIVRDVADGCADVEVLVPAGADPHDFEISAQQAARLRAADLVFTFGLGLERPLQDALDAAAADGVHVAEVAPYLDPRPFGAASDGTTDELDPHVWQDPRRMADAAGVIADALGTTTCGDGTDLRERFLEVKAALLSLDAEVAARYATIPDHRRAIVTDHDAFGYLADRYGLEVVGTVIPGGSSAAEPSAADLADLADTMEQEGVAAIFVEEGGSEALAEGVAAEADEPVEIVGLYSESLGGPGSGAETYEALVRTNAERITDALGG